MIVVIFLNFNSKNKFISLRARWTLWQPGERVRDGLGFAYRRRCRIKSNTSVNKNTSKHKYMCIQKETNKTWVKNLKLKRIHFSNTRKHARIQTQPRMQTHHGINTRANTHIRKTQTHKIRTNTQISILEVEIYKQKKSKILKLVFFLVDSVVVILFSFFFLESYSFFLGR